MTHKMVPFPTKIFIKDTRTDEELPASGGKIFNTFLKVPTKDYSNYLRMIEEEKGSGLYGSGFLDFLKKVPIVGNVVKMFTGSGEESGEGLYTMASGAFDWKETTEDEKLEEGGGLSPIQDKMFRYPKGEMCGDGAEQEGGFAFASLIPLIPMAVDLVKGLFSSNGEGSGINGVNYELIKSIEEDKPVYKEILYKDEFGNLIKKELVQITKLGEKMLLDQDFMQDLADINGVPRQEIIDVGKKIVARTQFPARLLTALKGVVGDKDKEYKHLNKSESDQSFVNHAFNNYQQQARDNSEKVRNWRDDISSYDTLPE